MRSSFFNRFEFGIFGFGGTLVNYFPIHAQAFATGFERFGIERELSTKYFFSTAGEELLMQFTGILEQQGKGASREQLKYLIDTFLSIIEQTPPLMYSGVEDVLRGLKQLHYQLFVSSSISDAEETLDTLGVGRYFSKVIDLTIIPSGPEHIHAFAQSAGQEVPDFCSKAFLASDDPSDMDLARKMRIYAIGIAHTSEPSVLAKAGAQEVIENFNELLYL